MTGTGDTATGASSIASSRGEGLQGTIIGSGEGKVNSTDKPQYQIRRKSGRFPGTPNDKGYTFNSLDPEELKNAGRMMLLDVWGDVEFTQSNEQTAAKAVAPRAGAWIETRCAYTMLDWC